MGDEPTLAIRSRTLDVHIAHLRAKLGHPPYLETLVGIGFRAAPRSASHAESEPGVDQIRGQRRATRRAWAWASPASPPAPVPPAPQSGIERRPGQ
jgi:hypothetical protein